MPHRMSTLFPRTLRENPADADVASHRLLVRAGYVRRVAAGVYTWLPLGLRVLNEVTRVVREEMERVGAQEILMPALLPTEPYERSGRDAEYGDLLFRLTDRRDGRYLLGPTHEEFVTLLVAGEALSYRNLPLTLFQVQTKYRDEARPRSGPLRGREFLMKDAYSFDLDDEGLRRSYNALREAYRRVLDRLGLRHRIVEALSGAMGGSRSEEFLAASPSGEDTYLACPSCGYAANTEAATIARPPPSDTANAPAMCTLHTPGAPGIADVVDHVARHLGGGVTASGMLKCVLFDVDGGPAAVLVPGNREVDEERLAAALAPAVVRSFTEEDFAARPDLVRGYVGPQDMAERSVPVYADVRVPPGSSWVTGANQVDHHVRDAVAGRDFTVDRVIEVATPAPGDPCPRCAGPLEVERAIEVGHVFQLGRRYADVFGLTVAGPDGTPVPVTMGCYGLGLSRMVAALAEQTHDARGLAWPPAAAPFDVHVVVIGRGERLAGALGLAERLAERGLRVVVDDRDDLSAGVKFTDAELIGVPRIIVAGRGLAEGVVELRDRRTGAAEAVSVDDLPDVLSRANSSRGG